MCGIYGSFHSKSALVQEIDHFSMLEKLRHRGPDDWGFWWSENRRFFMGHRRLSIIDLSKAAVQPMHSDNGRFTVVFNGELYNYKEIKSKLIKKGVAFKTESDTEVLLASYLKWGERCVEFFNGMFSFAVFDRGDQGVGSSIFFARDRVGKKPFYYFYDTKHFQFASELKAISHKGEPSLKALNYYLALGYIPDELCFIEGVKKLPPASAGRLNLDSFELSIWRYWQLPESNPDLTLSGEQLADQVEQILSDSISLRMASDVSLGVLLSGGLDSSLIAAIASKQSKEPLKTFTLSLPGSALDEAPYAKTVAEYLSSDHHVLELSMPSINDLEEIAHLIDEPLADSSLIPTYLISKLTRKYVKVVLGGDGGDELFGGYSDYTLALETQRKIGWIPKYFFAVTAKFAANLLPVGFKGRNRLSSLRGGPLQQQVWGTPYFDIESRKKLFSSHQLEILGAELAAPENFKLAKYKKGIDPIDSMTRSHFASILPDDFLVKSDRASMAVGLEMRSPFLDYRLVEFAFSKIPSFWKVFAGETRRVQRILAGRLLPENFNNRRNQGFSIPLDDWMRMDECKMIKKYMDFLPSFVEKEKVDNLINGLYKGRANGARLYSLLILGIAMKNLCKEL